MKRSALALMTVLSVGTPRRHPVCQCPNRPEDGTENGDEEDLLCLCQM